MRLNDFLPKIRRKAKISVLTTLVQNIAGDLSQCDKARIGNRRHIGKKGRNGIIAICI